MAGKFKIEITTPGKLVFSDNVEMATIPGEDGEFGVLAGHSAVISNLKQGIVNIYSNANDNNSVTDRIFVAGGFAEVNESSVSVLATESYDLSKITREELQAKIEAAQVKLNTSDSDFEKRRAQEVIELNQQILSQLS
jgi:F-type H+-transporting ATPase subunit epsilon